LHFFAPLVFYLIWTSELQCGLGQEDGPSMRPWLHDYMASTDGVHGSCD